LTPGEQDSQHQLLVTRCLFQYCRALLDMDFEEAERIEREVAEQSAFSI
jgi:hypothetical protein